MRRLITIMIVAAFVFLAIQLVPVSKTNPPITQDVSAPPDVEAVLRRACYDCHSNETQWPWYAHLAPASWLVTHDVNHGRKHLNFSTWDKYSDDPGTVIRKLKGITETSGNGKMPVWYYLSEHPRARLTHADREIIERWVSDTIVVEQKLEREQSPQ
jgi:hypothetical protein